MVVGIGIDSVSISEMECLLACGGAIEKRVFTEEEQAQASTRSDRGSYYAGRFAVKEAAAKALSGKVDEAPFDFQAIGTVDLEDGRPEVVMVPALRDLLASLGATEILVSLTNEGDIATAVALVQ